MDTRRIALRGLAAPLALCLVLVGGGCGGAGSEARVSPQGARLAALLDSMHVESHWIAGHHVHWRTGEPDGHALAPIGQHSHCSAFVAAVSLKLGVEMLHPPEHTQVLLANAQCAWLRGEGRRSGWEPVETPVEAQRLANAGRLVVACYVNPDPELPGHVAIVRPEALSRHRIESEGPQVTQAGVENFRSTSLAEGFRHHPGAWAKRAVRFYAHDAGYLGQRHRGPGGVDRLLGPAAPPPVHFPSARKRHGGVALGFEGAARAEHTATQRPDAEHDHVRGDRDAPA